MHPTRSRAASLLMAVTLTLVAGSVAAPTAAADSPEAAVNQLLDAVEGGDYEAIDTLVCEAERSAVRAMLDPGEAMGMAEARELLTFSVADRVVEVLSEDGDEATVRFSGTMSMNVAGDIEEVALSLLEADMGEMSQEDIDLMLPFLEMALTQTVPVDEELTVVREDSEWVVCGGLGEPVGEDIGLDDGFSNVSSTGLCGLVAPEELTSVGPLQYDNSSGWELTQCTYSTDDFEMYHSATVTVELDTDAAYAATAYGADQELEVAGGPAFTSSAQFNAPLIVQVGPDMLNVTVWPPDPQPEGYDGLAQSVAIAELFAPRVAESRADLIEPVKPLLCDLAFAGEFEAAMGMPMHSGNVSSDGCNFESTDAVRLRANVSQGAIDDFLMCYPEAEETTIAGQRALQIIDEYNTESFSIRVELNGEQVLDMTVEPAANDKPLSVQGRRSRSCWSSTSWKAGRVIDPAASGSERPSHAAGLD